jgi:glucokinase
MNIQGNNVDQAGKYLIGIDVGATKIAAGMGLLNGKILLQKVTPTIREKPEVLADQVAKTIQDLNESADSQGLRKPKIGIGICGGVDYPSGVVRSPIALGWAQPVPLREMLIARTGLGVNIDNDVNAGAIGEMLWGSARGAMNFVYISVGTGIGAGIVIAGNLYRGTHQTAGEIGHVTVDINGRPCACGNRGCLEAMAGGKALAEIVREELSTSPPRSSLPLEKKMHSGQTITARDLFQAAEEGDPYSRKVISRVGNYLAAAVAGLTNLLDLEKIILGGGLTQTGDLLFAAVQEALLKWKGCLVNTDGVLYPAKLGSNTGVAGAMGIAVQEPENILRQDKIK